MARGHRCPVTEAASGRYAQMAVRGVTCKGIATTLTRAGFRTSGQWVGAVIRNPTITKRRHVHVAVASALGGRSVEEVFPELVA